MLSPLDLSAGRYGTMVLIHRGLRVGIVLPNCGDAVESVSLTSLQSSPVRCTIVARYCKEMDVLSAPMAARRSYSGVQDALETTVGSR
jgi:hypothetical protein